jgi:DNA repair exonuclease SbcCD nuclease subunit
LVRFFIITDNSNSTFVYDSDTHSTIIWEIPYRAQEAQGKLVRIAHISDSHLGCSLFQLIERREDARQCLKKAVDMALRQSPDLLVHTGDLFHSHYPSMEDMNFAIELLKGLKDKLPVIVLQGNHDHPYGYHHNLSPLISLETMDLIISTGDRPYSTVTREFDGKKIEMHMVSWVSDYTFDRILRKAIPNEDTAIFLAHHIPTRKEELPIHFDYYGCGHKHNFWLDEEYSIGRPGSTCFVNWHREMGGRKKLIIIDMDEEGLEYSVETLNDVREFKFLTGLDITGMGPEEANNKMKEWLDRLSLKKEKPIIIMQVKGLIDSDTELAIERANILKYGEKRLDPLFLHIEPNWQTIDTQEIQLSEPLNIEKSVQEYMSQTEGMIQDEALRILKEIAGG